MKEDYASLMEWFDENDETFVQPFIEQNYRECSWDYEYQFMLKHIIYTKTILEDYKLSNDEKVYELIQKVYHGKSKIILIVGARGCLPKGTLIKTASGYRPIEKVKKVLSYNFDKRKLEKKQAIVYNAGIKKIFKIKTPFGEIKCSGEHKWFVERDGKIIVVTTTEINPKTDKLLQHHLAWQEKEGNNRWNENLISDEELKKLYIDEQRSIIEISKLKSCSEGCIKIRLKYLQIPIRAFEIAYKLGIEKQSWKDSHKRDNNSNKGNRKNYIKMAKENFEWKCMKCKALKTNDNFDLIVHHKDGNKKNNEIENLMVLCQGCHVNEHELGGNHAKN